MTEQASSAATGPANVKLRRRWFLTPFRDPWSGFATWLGTVLGAIGLYIAYGQNAPGLTFQVSPSRAPIVVSGRTSALRVFHGESEVTTDVTAAQVAFWNDGKREVVRKDVLEPIRLVTEPHVEILEAQWSSVTRALCRLEVDHSRAGVGELLLDFSILEARDGGVLQLIYAGPPQTEIAILGVVRGQPRIVKPSTAFRDWGGRFVGGVVVAGLALLVIGTIGGLAYEIRTHGFRSALREVRIVLRTLAPLFWVLFLFLILMSLVRLLGPARPPFAF